MKVQTPKEEWKTPGLPPPIYYKSDPTIGKTWMDKLESFKVCIKTQSEERDIETVAIYVPLFRVGSP